MDAKQAWGAFSLILALAVVTVATMLISTGRDPYQITAFAAIVLMVYSYILYKRYHIEMVTEGDVQLFSDEDDLRILCEIYGLGDSGRAYINRQRLRNFARENKHTDFVWIAPRFVHSFSSALEVEFPVEEEKELSVPELIKRLVSDAPSKEQQTNPLMWGTTRDSKRLSVIDSCPVCEAKVRGSMGTCRECGADLEFYAVLAGSKLGRRLLSAKVEAGKRKLRYSVATLQEKEEADD